MNEEIVDLNDHENYFQLLEKEIAEERARANEAKAMELASKDNGMGEQMNTGEQSVQRGYFGS